MLRERERQLNEIAKMEQDNIHLSQRVSTTKPTRSGVIREIKGIRCNTEILRKALEQKKRSHQVQNEENKIKKQNIFAEQDKNSLAHQRFNSIGYNNANALVPYQEPKHEDQLSHFSSNFSRFSRDSQMRATSARAL